MEKKSIAPYYYKRYETSQNAAVGDGSDKGKIGKVGKISNFGAVGDGSDKGKTGKVCK